MSLFKIRKKNDYSAVQTVRTPAKNHPFYELNNYNPKIDAEYELYSLLREAVPIIDAAICKTVRLVGSFKIECENTEIENLLNHFISHVKVNSSEYGLNAFISTYLDQLLTYGTAIGEIIPNTLNNDIAALYNASLKDVKLQTGKNPLNLEVCKRNENGDMVPLKYQNLLLVTPLKPEPGKIYGTSILKGLPFISGILLNIYHSINANWERVGNVRFAVTYKPGPDASEKAFAKERARQVADEWSQAMSSTSGVSDFVSVGDVSIKVIGADNQVLDSQVPVRQMLEQIVAKLAIPPFILGLSWSTTEKMSAQQADILTSELEFYRRCLDPVIEKICNMWLAFNGLSASFNVVWDNINLQDEVEIANARLMAARAAEIEKRLEHV
jgi:hypothetical protein